MDYFENVWSDSTHLNELLNDYPGLFEAIVLDVETTGIYRVDRDHKNYVLQLSIISAHTGMKIYDGYFKPRLKSWPEAESINHISPEMVKDCPSFRKELPKIQEIISAARVIIGYNIQFDVGFLEQEGVDFTKVRKVVDVMEDYAVWNGALHDYFHTFTWKKLFVAANKCGFDWEIAAHNSLGDCAATLHVARWLQKQHDEKGWIIYYPDCYEYEGELDCPIPDNGPCKHCKLFGHARVYDRSVIQSENY